MLRVLSEYVLLATQGLGQDLPAESRRAREAVIGLGDRKLTVKLNRRTHMSGGPKMTRICICEAFAPDSLEHCDPRLCSPACSPWPAIAQEAAMGEPLFACWAARRFLQDPRSSAELKDWLQGGRMGTHSFRRAAALAILAAGGFFSRLVRSGRWRSSAYRLYLGPGREGPRAVASI